MKLLFVLVLWPQLVQAPLNDRRLELEQELEYIELDRIFKVDTEENLNKKIQQLQEDYGHEYDVEKQ